MTYSLYNDFLYAAGRFLTTCNFGYKVCNIYATYVRKKAYFFPPFRFARIIRAVACHLPKVRWTTSLKFLYSGKAYFSSCEVRNHCIWLGWILDILCIASPLAQFLFMFRVAKEEAHNRMSASALAIVFAPCILRCPDSSDPLLSMKDINKTTLWESFWFICLPCLWLVCLVWLDPGGWW